MSAVPPAIEQRLSALVPRVRALRVAHGASRLVAAALGAAGVVLLLDAGFALAPWARGLFLSVWLTAVGVLTWRWVLVPWRAEIPLAEVAREVAKHLPELGERLQAVVTDTPGGPSGAVRAAVAEDTARRAKAVDLARAIPVKPVAFLTAFAAAALLAVVATAAFVPGSSDRIRRVALPWHRPGGAAFRVVVTSGEPVVKRGGPVTLSAYAERLHPGATAPADAVLILTDDPHGSERRLPMTGDGATFHVTLPSVPGAFNYCVELAGTRSEWFHVTALDAVELTEGTRVDLVPPAYATGRAKRTLTALSDLDGLEFTTAQFQLKFTLPAAAAHFDWRQDGATKPDLLAVELAPDRLSATAAFPLRTSGVLRLVLVREVDGKKLRTETAVNVRVTRDEPPWFEEVSGITTLPRTARPGARVPISFVARDDMSVSAAVLEYILDSFDSKSVIVEVPLTGAGTPRAAGRLDFELPKLRAGETIRFRLRVTDNRSVDDPKLAPQEAIYPPSGWSELKIAATAPPLDQQEIVGQRDALQAALSAARKELAEAATEADALRTATAGAASLAVDQTVRLNDAREKVRTAAARLSDAARDAVLTPELRPLATAVREVAERPLKLAEDALRAAETDDSPTRAAAFTTASTHLAEAGGKLNDIHARNARLAQSRLDRAKLTALAADQTALAGAADVTRQQELLARLAAIVAESDPLRAATDAAKGEEVRRLATALTELAARLRELDSAAKQTAADARTALVAAIGREQDSLTRRAAALFGNLETAARLAGIALPAPDDFRRIAELAAAGKTVEALTELEKHAQALDRLAAAFDKWHADRADPKLATKQLALWQDDLLARFRAAAKGGGFAKLPDDAKAVLRAEQKALHAAVEALLLPPDDGVQVIRKSAAGHTRRATDTLALDGAGADDAMRLAAGSLTQLSERTPSVGERLTKSLRDFEKLRQDLETSGNAVDAALKAHDRQSPDAAVSAAVAKKVAAQIDKQRKLIASISALDLPGLGERQARVALALKAAVSDLQDGSPLDIQASQLWARREFERLKFILEGNSSPDAKAEELHRKLAALADSLDAFGPTVTKQQMEPALATVQDALKQFPLAVAVEAPALVNDARGTVLSAESAFRDAKLTPAEVRDRIRTAATTLGRLSDRLNGSESDFDRVGRLAASRRLGAEKPKELLTSEEAGRQLGREADELTVTRVGAAGQVLKKRALDLYSKLRAKSDPDRIGSDLKALATTLDELAAKMADVGELTAGIGRAVPGAPPAAESFLPSKPLADALRDLAKQQRTLHAQVTNLAGELANRLRPAAKNPFAALEAEQRALAADATALAKQLATDPANKAVEAASIAAERLRLGQAIPAKEAAEHAANFFRQLATTGSDKPWGKQAAGLVTRQDAVIAELARLLDSPNAATAQQVARAAELARLAGEFASLLDLSARTFGPDDAPGKALTESAKTLTAASKQLAEAAKKAAEGNTDEAEKLRRAADATIRAATERVASAAPPPPPTGVDTATGLHLRTAEKAMRKAAEALAAGDPAGAQHAMRDAARALQDAAKGAK